MDLIICTLAAAVLSAAAASLITWTLLRRKETRIERESWSAARVYYTRKNPSP